MKAEKLVRLRAAVSEGDYLRAAILVSRKLRVAQLDRVLIMGTEIHADRPLLRKLREREPGLLVRETGAADVPSLARAFPHHAERYAVRFERGDSCLVVTQGEAPVAMGWIRLRHTGVINEMGSRLELAREDCWGHDTYVLPEHRARGAFAVLMWEMFRFLKARGLRSIYASVAWENTPSRASHSRLGYQTAMVIDRLWIAGLRVYRLEWPGRGRKLVRSALSGAPAFPLSG